MMKWLVNPKKNKENIYIINIHKIQIKCFTLFRHSDDDKVNFFLYKDKIYILFIINNYWKKKKGKLFYIYITNMIKIKVFVFNKKYNGIN